MWAAVNECRLVVLLEVKPNSNKYQQIVFNQNQFKFVSNAIAAVAVPTGQDEPDMKGYAHNVYDQIITLPENIQTAI